MTLPALIMLSLLAAGSVTAQASSDLMRVRQEILQTQYSKALKNASTNAQKQAVIQQYSDKLNPAGNGLDYGNLSPEQRATYGQKAMGAATQKAQGSSSWAQSRRKAAQERDEPTLNYYDLPGTKGGRETSPTLLPPQ